MGISSRDREKLRTSTAVQRSRANDRDRDPSGESGHDHPLQLPGQTRAYIEAPIFAQTSGYLKKWYFDIGAKVKAGEVLAEIDTPQVDQQFNQAQAQLKVAESARDLAESTFKRDQDLYNRKVIAAQDFDTAS